MEPKYLNININCNQIKYSSGRAYLIAMPYKSDDKQAVGKWSELL